MDISVCGAAGDGPRVARA